jgi:hypothetical protein
MVALYLSTDIGESDSLNDRESEIAAEEAGSLPN